jgi:adenylate cyclase
VAFNKVVIPLSPNGDVLIDYAGRNGIFPIISFTEVIDAYLRGDSTRLDIFRNAIVIVGATARAIGDHNSTPIADISPNCFIHANVAEQILSGIYIRPVPTLIYGVILMAMCVALGIFTQILHARWSLIWTVTLMMAYLDTAYAIFIRFGYVLPVFAPLIAVTICYTVAMSYSSSVERKRKSQIKEMFQKYVDVSIVEKLIENPTLLKLGGEVSEITTMFADVQGFTRLAEQLDPQKTVGILNTYFTDISHFILEQQGTLDKYIGDAVMGFWGAPLEDPDHAFHACSAALAMQHHITSVYRDSTKFSGPVIRQRIGLNTGTAVVGNMGSDVKFNYTAIGDSVNIASRLSGVNKEYGTHLLMTEYTYERVKMRVLAREIDNVLVLGKTKAVKMFELLSLVNDKHPDEFMRRLDSYQKGLALYKQREWKPAIDQFQDVLSYKRDDMVSHLYIQRSLFFMEDPPPDDWDGVFIMTRK